MKSVNSLAPKSTSSARPVLIEEIEAMNAPIRKVSSVILISIKQKTYLKRLGHETDSIIEKQRKVLDPHKDLHCFPRDLRENIF